MDLPKSPSERRESWHENPAAPPFPALCLENASPSNQKKSQGHAAREGDIEKDLLKTEKCTVSSNSYTILSKEELEPTGDAAVASAGGLGGFKVWSHHIVKKLLADPAVLSTAAPLHPPPLSSSIMRCCKPQHSPLEEQ